MRHKNRLASYAAQVHAEFSGGASGSKTFRFDGEFIKPNASKCIRSTASKLTGGDASKTAIAYELCETGRSQNCRSCRCEIACFGIALTVIVLGVASRVFAQPPRPIRMGPTGSIVRTYPGPAQQRQADLLLVAAINPKATGASKHPWATAHSQPPDASAQYQDGYATAGATYPFPRPRLAGFQPFVAITTSSKTSNVDIDYEHDLEPRYDCHVASGPDSFNCGALNPPANQNFIIGVLDTGSVADLASGIFADTLGLNGPYLTSNVVPIGGVGGSVDALVTQPVGWYAAGLSAVNAGQLDISALVGHSNSAGLVVPPIICDETLAVTGFIGTSFLAFYTTLINVDDPRRAEVDGLLYKGPNVRIQQTFEDLPDYAHSISLTLVGLSPVATASYYPDIEDLETPIVPTLLSLSALSFPTGGAFFADIQLREGPPDVSNPPIQREFMLDTGAQASIISQATAADLSLPREPDFTVDVCGVSGVIERVPGYYVDYVRMSAFGGAVEFSKAPFIVMDLPSPDGSTMDGIIGMNFFWNRNVAFEPSLTGSSFFHVSAPIPFAFGDFDADSFVDGDDMFFWSICQTAPGEPPIPDCDHLDRDEDGDVDAVDFAHFQRCFSGPDPADPSCQ